MVKVRAATIMAGVSGHAGPMAGVGAKGMSIVSSGKMSWSGKGAFLKNLPYTIENPHLGQAEQRIAFADAASTSKNSHGLDPKTGLPKGAAAVQSELSGSKAPHRMSKKAYPSKIKSSYHTVAQLRSMVGRGGRVKATSRAKSHRRL